MILLNKLDFESYAKSIGYKEDSELDGMLYPCKESMYTWFNNENKTMAISLDLEYTVYRTATTERLDALKVLFEK